MHPVLKKNLYFVKEHIGMFKAANNFDIVDPDTQKIIMRCREPKLGFFKNLMRFTDYKPMMPFNVGGKFSVLDDEDKQVCMLKGKWTSWDFSSLAGEEELGHVTKKWGGLAKEMFTSADTMC